MKILIDRITYPIYSLGPGKRAVIWTVGCPHRCKGCSNPELWEKDKTKAINIVALIEILLSASKTGIDGITITGGDPFYQVVELNYLVSKINEYITEDILIYAGYKIAELKNISGFDPEIFQNRKNF